ncbi:endonuclease/exonuclease/phosphatase family protein [Alistipes sp.]|uniref:endonuclease/exonuclease/phosphatase family protein n=1 Tax=Alistipes sp. TaxID=1872444 RepID=UPI003AF174D1
MKLLKHIIRAGALGALLLTTAAVQAQQVSLKVFVWNVLSFERVDKSGEAAGFPVGEHLALIKAQNPDIVCLNEFETGTSRMGKEKMAELATELGMYSYYVMSYPKDVGYYGNVILSKYPILNSGSKLFTYENAQGPGNYQFNSGWQMNYYGSDQRSIGYVDILVPTSDTDGRIVRIACTHFDHVAGQATIQQPEAIEFLQLENPPYPTLLMGDLNTSFTNSLNQMNKLGELAFVSWVDHIICFPKGAWTWKDGQSVSSGALSDHNAAKATVELK